MKSCFEPAIIRGDLDPEQGDLIGRIVEFFLKLQRKFVVAAHEPDVGTVVFGAGKVEIAGMKPQENGGFVQVLLDIRTCGRGVEDDFPSKLPFVVPPGMGLERARKNGDKYYCRRYCRKSGEKKPAH